MASSTTKRTSQLRLNAHLVHSNTFVQNCLNSGATATQKTTKKKKRHSTEAHTVSRSKASVGIWTPVIRRAPRAHKKPSDRGKKTHRRRRCSFVNERERGFPTSSWIPFWMSVPRCEETKLTRGRNKAQQTRDPYGGRGILLHFDVRLFRYRWKKDDDDDDDIRCSEQQQQRLRCFPQQNTRKQKYKRRLKLRAALDKGPTELGPMKLSISIGQKF